MNTFVRRNLLLNSSGFDETTPIAINRSRQEVCTVESEVIAQK
jgi:hypothetical protein